MKQSIAMTTCTTFNVTTVLSMLLLLQQQLHLGLPSVSAFLPVAVPAGEAAFRSRTTTTTTTRMMDVRVLATDAAKQRRCSLLPVMRMSSDDDEPERLKKQAETLREQIRQMEKQLGDQRKNTKQKYDVDDESVILPQSKEETLDSPSLNGKRVLVTGANGRLGSMVCRYLLRNYPQTEVIAVVHYVGEQSPTARGYARLSYEVGAEDGIGSIGAAWSSEDRTATFEYNDEIMKGYNLQNLRLVECELLDPVQCQTIAQDSQCDCIIWCATDFNGNQPRAVASLDVALLFRAVSRPTKGRVEVEGLQNMLGALKRVKQDAQWKVQTVASKIGVDESKKKKKNDPIDFVLVSIAPEVYPDYETPFGSFSGIKEQGETIIRNDFPSLSHTVLQFGRFDDNFVAEGLDANVEEVSLEKSEASTPEEKQRRRINRRDAARFAVEALLNKDLEGKTVQVWTDPK